MSGKYVPGSGQVFPTLTNFLSYNPDISSYQILNHEELWWQNSIYVGKGRIMADIGYTHSVRHEIDTGSVAEENMFVQDIPYSVKYQVDGGKLGLKLTTGVNGVYEFMKNGPEPPAPYIGDFEIPDYHIFDMGGYSVLQKDGKNLTLSGGLRYDVRSINGRPMYLADYRTPEQQEVSAGQRRGLIRQFPRVKPNIYRNFGAALAPPTNCPRITTCKAQPRKKLSGSCHQ